MFSHPFSMLLCFAITFEVFCTNLTVTIGLQDFAYAIKVLHGNFIPFQGQEDIAMRQNPSAS